MNLLFAVLDESHVDATATWAVITGDRCVGYVSEYSRGHYRVDRASVAVPVPRGDFHSRDDAGWALVEARATAPLRRRSRSGLVVLDELILTAERGWLVEPGPGQRDEVAARLGVSPTNYLQRLRMLRDDPAAFAFDPQTVRRLRERHTAALTRTARLRRDSVPLAAAS